MSPVLAMLWENWRLTRAEAAQRLALAIVGGSAALVWFRTGVSSGAAAERGATFALGSIIMLNFPTWVSIGRLKGGRFLDGYRPGFPLSLLYARPIRTAALVGVPMAYQAILAATVYLLSALALRVSFGFPFPLLSIAALIAAGVVGQLAGDWSTRSKIIQLVGSAAPFAPLGALMMFRWKTWPTPFAFSLADYALMAAVATVSYGLAVAGVARQRRGDAGMAKPKAAGSAAYPEWLVNLFRFPCPASSTTRAQIWFELRSSGLPILVIGAALALLNPLLFVATGRIDIVLSGIFAKSVAVRLAAVIVAMLSVPVLLVLGGNAFGIRSRQGRTQASVFDATLPAGSARMAGLKILVRSVSLLAALVAVVTSIWISVSFIPFDVLDDHDPFIEKSRSPLSGWMRGIRRAISAMSAEQLLALAFVAFVVLVAWVALRASISALQARYPRRAKTVWSLLLFDGLLLVLLGWAEQRGIVSTPLFYGVQRATNWAIASTVVLATIYLGWRVFGERLLTLRQACVGVLVTLAFGAALMVLSAGAGVPPGATRATDAAMVTTALWPVMVGMLAPWSLSRIRHT